MFFLILPSLFLNIVVPETKISTPAFLAILALSKLIPPSISISTASFFLSISFLNYLTFSNVSLIKS